ncbi:NUDIX hydrolase [Leptolyngbya sp. FACHB-261]|uniref:NUDIX hydrolase n=1 Tax=Leptolyngbya sp. FACHB-261 TaxID=2692806 RepID=UPI001685F1F3|nr:NUDIX hydrolase [Leptolyngbya sp. FACHB-261]MBD2099884.1 NUDIX hydrolase [Leptolyngbya sp. FACHB-261]
MEPKWLEWAKQLQAIAQNGLTFADSPFDLERYTQIREIASEIMAAHTGVEPTYVRELFAGEVGYATPKVDVRGAVFRDNTILLVKEREDGCWTLPGGWADVGESPGNSVVREIAEESGYHTRVLKLAALYDRSRHPHPPLVHHVYKVFFICELLSGTPSSSIETDGAEFFAETALPELSLGRVTPGQIARLFEHYRHMDWPTDFD